LNTHILSVKAPDNNKQLLILEKYKIEIGNGNFGINTVKFDELIQHHSADYLDKFM